MHAYPCVHVAHIHMYLPLQAACTHTHPRVHTHISMHTHVSMHTHMLHTHMSTHAHTVTRTPCAHMHELGCLPQLCKCTYPYAPGHAHCCTHPLCASTHPHTHTCARACSLARLPRLQGDCISITPWQVAPPRFRRPAPCEASSSSLPLAWGPFVTAFITACHGSGPWHVPSSRLATLSCLSLGLFCPFKTCCPRCLPRRPRASRPQWGPSLAWVPPPDRVSLPWALEGRGCISAEPGSQLIVGTQSQRGRGMDGTKGLGSCIRPSRPSCLQCRRCRWSPAERSAASHRAAHAGPSVPRQRALSAPFLWKL